MVGLTSFSYATTVQFTVQPGATDTLRYQLDLIGLDGQATGLIGGALTVRDAAGDPISSIPMVTDVRGSLISVYGLFGIALVVLTGLALLDAALAVAKHGLSHNRWQRGLRLLAPGVGIGLVLAFSASVARLWVPNTGRVHRPGLHPWRRQVHVLADQSRKTGLLSQFQHRHESHRRHQIPFVKHRRVDRKRMR